MDADNLGGFESENDGMIYNYHYPKPSDIVPEQEEYIINYIHDFEAIMLDQNYADYETGYPSILDISSFVDFILLQELPKNVDAYRLSTYIYKDKESINNKLQQGQSGTSTMVLEIVTRERHGLQRVGCLIIILRAVIKWHSGGNCYGRMKTLKLKFFKGIMSYAQIYFPTHI